MLGLCPKCGARGRLELIEDAECQEVLTLMTWPITIYYYTCEQCYTPFEEGGCEWSENAPEGG